MVGMIEEEALQRKEKRKREIIEAYHFRHACKEFDPEGVIPEDDFTFLLEAARLSPSSVGMEPWRFVIVQNRQLREKIRAVSWGAQGQLPTASHFVIILARGMNDLVFGSDYMIHIMRDIRQMSEEVIAKRANRYREFQSSDFKLLESERAMFDWACKQTYIALANMMSAAAEIGIDSCPIEGFDRDKLEALLHEEGLLDSEHFGVSCMAAFGYRVRDPQPKIRQPLQDIVDWVK